MAPDAEAVGEHDERGSRAIRGGWEEVPSQSRGEMPEGASFVQCPSPARKAPSQLAAHLVEKVLEGVLEGVSEGEARGGRWLDGGGRWWTVVDGGEPTRGAR